MHPCTLALARADGRISFCWTSCCPTGWLARCPRSSAANDETREIPIVFLSARSTSGDQVRGHGTGGVGHITKPFDPLVMTNTVRDALMRVRRGEREAMRASGSALAVQ